MERGGEQGSDKMRGREMDRQRKRHCHRYRESETEKEALTPVSHAMVSRHDVSCLPIIVIELLNQLHHLLYPSIHHLDVHQILPVQQNIYSKTLKQ